MLSPLPGLLRHLPLDLVMEELSLGRPPGSMKTPLLPYTLHDLERLWNPRLVEHGCAPPIPSSTCLPSQTTYGGQSLRLTRVCTFKDLP